MKRFQMIVVCLVLSILLLTTFAWAYPNFIKTFSDTYKVDKDSALLKAKCGLCHVGSETNKFNPYGADVRKAMNDAKTKKLTKDILVKVEGLDSDKDGASNIDEIKACTLPGDATSKPGN